MGHIPRVIVWLNMHVEEKKLIALKPTISFTDAGFPSPNTLDFSPLQLDARRVSVGQEVAKRRFFVLDLDRHTRRKITTDAQQAFRPATLSEMGASFVR